MRDKKAGIVCDNYKVQRFKKELSDAGFEVHEEKPFTRGTTVLTVLCTTEEIQTIHTISRKVEFHFKRAN